MRTISFIVDVRNDWKSNKNRGLGIHFRSAGMAGELRKIEEAYVVTNTISVVLSLSSKMYIFINL